jgi:hypothetical protein
MPAGRLAVTIVTVCRAATVAMLLLGAVGCQQSQSTVSGIATLDGKPLAIQSDERGTVVFQPASGQGSPATGLLDSTGRFKLAAGSSLSIAPGKYHVAISVVRMAPGIEGAEQGALQITPAKYSSASTSGMSAEVLPSPNEFTFDMKSTADQSAATVEGSESTANSSGAEQARTPSDK